ncbi:sugar isomerase domain-containing protein [Georgenia sp. 311]|uniref:sugar isomerase domain-containing protein n=1 Tax=Georgenia sp. 311 TaxID=2585134 RepID=UPI001112A4FD|nr:sugar isomerase domain-containing protein [Georgenia sp. 311]TNC18034.1 sugar isomerase domain-containing protein [Georgenia sp. 311]
MTDVLAGFSHLVTEHITRVLTDAEPDLRATAQEVVRAGREDRLVHTTGAGHSLAGVIESFYRAGGLARVRPLWHPDLLPLGGALRSTTAERTPGLAREVVEGSGIGPGDVLVVFSNSGINHYPVEAALLGREAGATVVAVTSREASAQAPLRAGRRLYDLSDVVIDTQVPAGDATWPAGAPRTAPLSSIVNAAVWDAVLVLAHDLDPDLPLWQSANIADPAVSNEDIAAGLAGRVPELHAGT